MIVEPVENKDLIKNQFFFNRYIRLVTIRDLNDYLYNNGYFLNKFNNINNFRDFIIKPVKYIDKNINKFTKDHAGKTAKDFNFEFTTADKLEWKDNYIIWRSNGSNRPKRKFRK